MMFRTAKKPALKPLTLVPQPKKTLPFQKTMRLTIIHETFAEIFTIKLLSDVFTASQQVLWTILMQQTTQVKNSMYVPNWLIALELGAGAALLYISSSALVTTDMHVSRNHGTPATIEESESTSTANTEEKIILSAHSGAATLIK